MTGTVPDPVAVETREGFCIWLKYDDGVEGELDLSDLAGLAVFKAWDDRAFFEGVHINEDGVVSWGAFDESGMELDIAPETSYAQILGITREAMAEMPDESAFYEAIADARAKRGVQPIAGD